MREEPQEDPGTGRREPSLALEVSLLLSPDADLDPEFRIGPCIVLMCRPSFQVRDDVKVHHMVVTLHLHRF